MATTATGHPGEVRLPAAVAVVAAITLYALLPSRLTLGPRLVVPALEVLLFIPVLAANPHRLRRENTWLRKLSLGLVLLIAATNLLALVQLLRALLESHTPQGSALVVGAGQVWLTNILVFGLCFWELDRGGPVVRTQVAREDLPAADFRFPQDEDHDAVGEVATRSSVKSGWLPGFVDYLYVSVTNSSAFSPTDTMPLSARAKCLMAVESVSAILLSVLVIARGVSLLQ
ncbi:hypothetical protein CLV35_2672 [Motilibacter peucedani]|uniref:DUF1345 domain-containing protein n=1 Tax=Motilibacter peucedani TaxID=598650 RepID=A0A420XM14_9ACTN|nr:hypothetical protein [Motilibacter peucedani]RKS72428.1 hypothetical protein CLV35_2672 [Motilibacter peucedani]